MRSRWRGACVSAAVVGLFVSSGFAQTTPTAPVDLVPPYGGGYVGVKVRTENAVPGDFNLLSAQFPNLTDPRHNSVFGWGYNCTGGNPERPSEHMLCWMLETYFENGAERKMEHHLVYVNPTGWNTRAIQMDFDRATNRSGLGLAFERIDWRGKDSTTLPWMTWYSEQMQLNGNTSLIHQKNNVVVLRQLNSGMTGPLAYANLMWLDAQDRVVLGQMPWLPGGEQGPRVILANPNEGDTALLLMRRVGGVASTQPVKLGPPDSGGAGFRALVTPN